MKHLLTARPAETQAFEYPSNYPDKNIARRLSAGLRNVAAAHPVNVDHSIERRLAAVEAVVFRGWGHA